MASMELEALSNSIGELFGLEGIADTAKDVLLMTVGATVAFPTAYTLINKIPWVKDQDKKIQGGVALVLAVAAGALTDRYIRNDMARKVAVGASIGLGLAGAAQLFKAFAPEMAAKIGLSGFGAYDLYDAPSALYGTSVEDRVSLPGMVNGLGLSVQDQAPALAGLSTQEVVPLGAWIA